jgi:hypothetical protein
MGVRWSFATPGAGERLVAAAIRARKRKRGKNVVKDRSQIFEATLVQARLTHSDCDDATVRIAAAPSFLARMECE